ncbi:MAG: manganese-binding transcriptional regulator MntR [Candidatus Puniceispirillales bacterium]
MTISKTQGKPEDSAQRFERIRRAHQSEVAEDYVEMIAELIAETGEARAVDLASRFGVTAPTVNATIQRLAREGLVVSQPYRSIFLTDAGRDLAQRCAQRHAVVRDFLIAIGVDAATAEADAEGLEHHVSEATLDAFREVIRQHGKDS